MNHGEIMNANIFLKYSYQKELPVQKSFFVCSQWYHLVCKLFLKTTPAIDLTLL